MILTRILNLAAQFFIHRNKKKLIQIENDLKIKFYLTYFISIRYFIKTNFYYNINIFYISNLIIVLNIICNQTILINSRQIYLLKLMIN